jgi:hypothetical protein
VSGPIDCVPAAAFAPVQSPLAAQAFALVELQVSVDVPPCTIAFGLALSATVGGGFGGMTLTVTACDEVPPGPLQVSVNAVLAVSALRASEPLSGRLPLHPPVAVQLDALVAAQLSVVVPPLATVEGVAISDTDGGGCGAGWVTVTVTDCAAAAAPPAPTHVSVKFEVDVRPERASEPLSGLAPLHAPDAVQPEALVTDQLSVLVPPLATVGGVAVSVTVGGVGADGGATVTVTDCAALPPSPEQVSTYVAVAARFERSSEPCCDLEPVHAPLAVQLVALVEFQLNVVAAPFVSVEGVAASVTVGAGAALGGRTVTSTVWVAVPPAPVQVSANDELAVSTPVFAVPEVALGPLQLPDAVHAEAFVDDQLRVTVPPELTVEGDADSETDGPVGLLGGCMTFAVTVWPAVPPAPLQVSVYEVVAASAPVDSVPSRLLVPLHPPEAAQAEASDEVHIRLAAAVW